MLAMHPDLGHLPAMASSASPVRRRNAAASRARILSAAKQCFSEQGYAATGIREVAAVAGVSYTLLSRYFGSKAGLLEAALHDSIHFEPIIDVDRSRFGEHLARIMIENIRDDTAALMTIVLAGDPSATDIVARVVETRLIEPLAEWIGPPSGRERAVAVSILGIGFVTHMRNLRLLGPQTQLDLAHPTVRWLGHSFQAILDDAEEWNAAKPNFVNT